MDLLGALEPRSSPFCSDFQAGPTACNCSMHKLLQHQQCVWFSTDQQGTTETSALCHENFVGTVELPAEQKQLRV